MSEYGKKYPGSGGATGPGTRKDINVTPEPFDQWAADLKAGVDDHDRDRLAAGLPSLDDTMSTERWLGQTEEESRDERRREAEFYLDR
jgi:hypothetical protein